MTGAELAVIRRSLNLTQRQLAKKVELSENSISRYEMPSNQRVGREVVFPVPRWLAREMNRLLTAAISGRMENEP